MSTHNRHWFKQYKDGYRCTKCHKVITGSPYVWWQEVCPNSEVAALPPPYYIGGCF